MGRRVPGSGEGHWSGTAKPAGSRTAATSRPRVTTEVRLRAHRLPAHGTGLDHPAADEERAGRGGADAIGGFVKEYQIRPDPMKLVGYGLSFADLTRAVEANNATRGANYVERNGEGYVVRAGGLIENMDQIRDIVVATRTGVPIKVSDVAEVGIGRELRTGSASENGHEVVLGTALMLIGENSRTVSAAADAKIREINKLLPPGIQARTLLSRTDLVDATVRTVARNLAEGALLVVAVLFLALGNIGRR